MLGAPRGDAVGSPDGMPEGTVSLVLSSAGTVFVVHESMLRSRSTAFNDKLDSIWVDGMGKRIALPDENPDTVKRYVHYLYTGKAFKDVPENSFQEYTTLADVYVLAEKLQDRKLKDAVFTNVVNRPKGSGRAIQVVAVMYSYTPSGSTSRWMMMDIHAQCMRCKWVTESIQHGNPEFVTELARGLSCTSEEPRHSAATYAGSLPEDREQEQEGHKRKHGE